MSRLTILLVLAILAGCVTPGSPTTEPTPAPDVTPDPADRAAPASASVDLVEEPGVGVPPKTLGIRPARLELAVGQAVNLTVTNRGQGGHDLVIDGLGVATAMLAGGASESIVFTPLEAGTYRMYCSIGGDGPLGHAARGMEGEVVVA